MTRPPLDETSPHDALFKATFGVPEHAAGELVSVLEPEVVAQLDLSTLARVPGSFVTPGQADRHADVLFSVRLRGGGEGLVYVLLEHQSTADRWMVLRVLRYVVRIWERWLSEHPGARRLPPVLPVVVSHDPAGWSVPATLGEALDLDARALAAMRPHLPLFRMAVDDLAAVSDAALRRRAMTAMGRVALGLLKHARRFDVFLGDLGRWTGAMREVIEAPGGLSALAVVLTYMHLINDQVPREQVAERLGAVLGTGAKEAFMTEGERLIQQGREEGLRKGLQEGLEQGLEQGVLQGQRTVLRHQLERRFGALPAGAIERLEAAGSDELDRWADRVLIAATLEEVVGA